MYILHFNTNDTEGYLYEKMRMSWVSDPYSVGSGSNFSRSGFSPRIPEQKKGRMGFKSYLSEGKLKNYD